MLMGFFFIWRPQPDLNRCCRRERPLEEIQGGTTHPFYAGFRLHQFLGGVLG